MNSIAKDDAAKVQTEMNPDEFFQEYHRDVFKQAPIEFWLDGWKIEYFAIADQKPNTTPPLSSLVVLFKTLIPKSIVLSNYSIVVLSF